MGGAAAQGGLLQVALGALPAWQCRGLGLGAAAGGGWAGAGAAGGPQGGGAGRRAHLLGPHEAHVLLQLLERAVLAVGHQVDGGGALGAQRHGGAAHLVHPAGGAEGDHLRPLVAGEGRAAGWGEGRADGRMRVGRAGQGWGGLQRAGLQRAPHCGGRAAAALARPPCAQPATCCAEYRSRAFSRLAKLGRK
jgi:hypothetical protein